MTLVSIGVKALDDDQLPGLHPDTRRLLDSGQGLGDMAQSESGLALNQPTVGRRFIADANYVIATLNRADTSALQLQYNIHGRPYRDKSSQREREVSEMGGGSFTITGLKTSARAIRPILARRDNDSQKEVCVLFSSTLRPQDALASSQNHW